MNSSSTPPPPQFRRRRLRPNYAVAAAPSPRSRRSRRRALRMSRECEIPSLALLRRQPSPPPPPAFRATLHALFHKELQLHSEEEQMQDYPPLHYSGAGMRYDERGLSECSSGGGYVSNEDNWGDIVDLGLPQPCGGDGHCVGRRLRSDRCKKQRQKKEMGSPSSHGALLLLPPCSSSSSSTTGNNTAVGGGDVEDDISLAAEDWELQAEVLAAECNLLRVENELVLRKWKRGLLCASEPNGGFSEYHTRYHNDHAGEESLQSLLEKMHAMHDTTTKFAHATMLRLQDISRKASCCSKYEEAGSQLVSDEATDDECGNGRNIKFHNVWDTPVDSEDDCTPRDIRTVDRCHVEDDVLKQQRDLMLPGISGDGGVSRQEFIRREYRAMLCCDDTSDTQQMPAEDLSYRAAIQQMVAQVEAEVEQWSQVQDVLHNLQNEMDNLKEAREIWEERALRAEACVSSLKESVHHWRQRAQNAEEEAMVLESKSQTLRRKMRTMKQRHAAERASWLECEAGGAMKVPPSEEASSSPPQTEVQKNICTVSAIVAAEVEEKPRPANVGTREDYALCESIVHSRNESTRSSFDLGALSLKNLHKRNKKSFDFSNSSNDSSNTTAGKSRAKNQKLADQLLKIDSAARLDFCSKTSDVNRKAGHKSQKLSEASPTVELARLEVMEPMQGGEYPPKGGRADENLQPYESPCSEMSIQEDGGFQQGRLSVSHHQGTTKGCRLYSSSSFSSKPPRSLPHPPPLRSSSRVPFGEIMNSSPMSRILKTRNGYY